MKFFRANEELEYQILLKTQERSSKNQILKNDNTREKVSDETDSESWEDEDDGFQTHKRALPHSFQIEKQLLTF